jgi:organic radical activating enzyme
MNDLTDINKLRDEIVNSETFCFYPFLELSTNPSGHIKPCCNHKGTMHDATGKTISILNGSTFDSAWNSDHMIELRKKLSTGHIPEQCNRCIRDGAASMRKRSVDEYKNNLEVLTLVKDTIENEYVANHNLKRLELKPSTLCNLKCVICNSYDSSQISKEIKALSEKHSGIEVESGRVIRLRPDIFGIIENNNVFTNIDPDWSDNDEIWKNFERLVPYLEVISFAGGEPTIMPFVLKALKYCVDTGYSKNIHVYVSSNFTNLNKSFFELMHSYRKFELIASIDGTEKVQEYARFPSKWNVVSNNYMLAKQYTKYNNVKILMNITVNILNIINLTDLLYWLEDRAKEYPYFKEHPYNINLLMHPPEQQIHLLSDSNKTLVTSRLEEYLTKSTILKECVGLDSKIHLLLSELKRPRDPVLFEKFKQYISILDEHRENDIRKSIPELDLD